MIIEGDILPDFDVHASLLSLPGILGTDLESIPSRVPYLSAKSVPSFNSNPNPNLRVGVVWAGNRKHPNNDSIQITISALLIYSNSLFYLMSQRADFTVYRLGIGEMILSNIIIRFL